MNGLGISRLTAMSVLAVASSSIVWGGPPNNVVSDGQANTAMGSFALYDNNGSQSNTAAGYDSMRFNTTGSFNTAFGVQALDANKTAQYNVGIGAFAMFSNQAGIQNTAVGYSALQKNTASNNVAVGASALFYNTTGYQNTATGWLALNSNTTGTENVASGAVSLLHATTGSLNSAFGAQSQYSTTSGSENSAVGFEALFSTTTGGYNTALGAQALYYNEIGTRNVAIGFQSGFYSTGSDNILIGAQNMGKAAENGVIRIGNKTYQKKMFVAGVSGVTTGSASATAVFVDTNGQLGTIKSSRRYKTDIQPMGNISERVLALRPVIFRYKRAFDDGSRPVQFGLVAEEVAEVFPELVVANAQGKPETVRYDLLASLLVNEFQKDHERIRRQADELAQLKRQVALLAQQRTGNDRDARLAAAH